MTDNSPPQFEFDGLRFHASRDGDRVTGRVVFPYRTSIGDHCPIDYCRIDPPRLSRVPMTACHRMRLDAVLTYQTLVKEHPKANKRALAAQVVRIAAESGDTFSVRSLQSWVRKHELEGIDGLRTRLVAAPKRRIECSADEAKDALLVCGWWASRIANVKIIDTKMMHAALALVKRTTPVERPWSTADLLAIIDCYYSWSCDRERYPFKPFARWSKYDIETWALRAADRNDYRRAAYEAGRKERVPLRDPIKGGPSITPSPKQRVRETTDRRTRTAIRNLDGAAPANSRCAVAPPSPAPDGRSTISAARALNRLGFTGASRSVAADLVTTGPEPIAAITEPETMAEALGLLEDRWRLMLIRASQGDRTELDAAVATISMWWDAMPKTLRSNIDACSKQWCIDHPTVPDATCDRRRVMQILVHLKRRSGAQRLAVAARM